MIDGLIRPKLVPLMDSFATRLSQSGLSANAITITGLITGLAGCFLVSLQMYPLGLILVLLSLLADGLGGAGARATQTTEVGAWVDMMAGVILFAGFPFFFMLSSSSETYAAAASLLLLSYVLMGMANLSYDYFAMKKGAAPAKGGLVESGEIIIFMTASCLYPAGFSLLAAALALLGLIAAVLRMKDTVKLLKD